MERAPPTGSFTTSPAGFVSVASHTPRPAGKFIDPMSPDTAAQNP